MSVGYASQAVATVSAWLPVAHRDGGNIEARAQLMIGAHLAGRALTLSGLGLVHGIGHAITAHTGTPHGIALAAVLPEVMRLCLPVAQDAYTQAATALRVHTADAAIAAVGELCDASAARHRLRDLGVDDAMLGSIAAAALADPVTNNSPLIPAEEQVHTLLSSVH